MWYYAESGRQLGPLDDAAFGQLVASGRVDGGTLVWRAGMSNWQPFRTLEPPGISLNGAAAPLLPVCSQCRLPFPSDELVTLNGLLVCAACKPAFAQRLREGVLPAGRFRYGGFWIRGGALLIDIIIMYVFGSILAAFWIGIDALRNPDPMALLRSEGLLIAVQLVIDTIYETWFVGRFGATLGQLACHLKVVRPDGSRVTYARAFGRYNAKFVSSITFGIGYLIAAFDPEKRALHDYLCDTRVIRR